jgi:signal transduction histidine kinase
MTRNSNSNPNLRKTIDSRVKNCVKVTKTQSFGYTASIVNNRLGELQKFVHYNALVAWRTKDFWVRALLCWIFGAALLANDELASFDVRLEVRGPRPSSGKVVLVNIPELDWAGIIAAHELSNNPSLLSQSRNVIRPLKEINTVTDGFFWNTSVWEKLLAKVLLGSPKAIGITLFFGENIHVSESPSTYLKTFEDPRIIWGANIDNTGRIHVPLFASTYNTNVGIRDLRLDDDGNVRRFSSAAVQAVPIPHLAVRLAAAAEPRLTDAIKQRYLSPTLINYSGDGESFKVVGAKELLDGHIDHEVFRDRVVIIGSLESSHEQIQTPLGRMSRTEIIANITDNVLTQSTITRLRPPFYLWILAALMIGAIWVLVTYPQSVTLVAFTLAAILWAAASIWAFDVLNFWIPVFSPLAQLTVTCIVFLSYQLALNERRTWSLKQEQLYFTEIEQLKSNFVSMMSHDLKTPIAKIQAICDRLIAAMPDAEIALDLKNLRASSDELHRYIQSILQVTKVEAKEFEIQKEVTDINENIERVFARLQPLAKEKGLKIQRVLEPLFSIEADSTLIQEVIHNLIENAIKYTPSTDAHGTQGKVTITSQEKDDNVVVVVEDTGPGIDPRDHSDIWRKFTRGRHQTSEGAEIRGTGLGLYLVKYFIELHGGQVFLESVLGHGTKVGFSIPIADTTIDSNADSNGRSTLDPDLELSRDTVSSSRALSDDKASRE